MSGERAWFSAISMGNIWSELKYIYYAVEQSFPPEPQFSIEQIPDLTGRVVIVTGGSTSVGRETVKVLLKHNAKVYLAARDREKTCAAIKELQDETGKEAIFLELDLSRFHSIQTAAKQFLSKEPELHILFNNAGVMACPIDLVTIEGYDMQFGINVVGPFLFTELLLPALKAGAEASPDHHSRIITTSSSAAYCHTINWDALRDGPARTNMSPSTLYCQSKFANVVVAHEAAKRYADMGIISISCHPGNIETDLQRCFGSRFRQLLNHVLYPAPMGALTLLWAGTMPETLNYNGQFLIPFARVGRCREEAYDPALGERLWNWLEDQVHNN
ncbi:hypothetical protein A0H81_00306 [Grifola frondosa]|uniref:NAD(P)-binding protein n=1 Tax=Grifola frondosa TaxID=5627 RepID=A0A1C7MQ47_GRIFR|nr:hypothetical protein A0H81_00306 [Grifola frondosa]